MIVVEPNPFTVTNPDEFISATASLLLLHSTSLFVAVSGNTVTVRVIVESWKRVIVSRDKIDCLVIPCVAISKDNRRVGYGKGYYDRYLAGYNGYKIGITYNECNNLDIDTDDFDVKLDEIIVG